MLVSNRFVIIAWIMAVLLIVNSSMIIFHIFDFSPSGIRHLVSFVATLGILTGFLFGAFGILRFFNLSRLD